ncbi:hypothetical protein DLM75_03860 [Leptospira stimsonii]|uniref:Uncharacterized protein n=1 Tax=Leptospira stimsonii TaxID=2202203 RepID=A0A396ZDL7_9LEPT|nr:hypothetical protein DLM75_03860 [Leptospira stimsonii]
MNNRFQFCGSSHTERKKLGLFKVQFCDKGKLPIFSRRPASTTQQGWGLFCFKAVSCRNSRRGEFFNKEEMIIKILPPFFPKGRIDRI